MIFEPLGFPKDLVRGLNETEIITQAFQMVIQAKAFFKLLIAIKITILHTSLNICFSY